MTKQEGELRIIRNIIEDEFNHDYQQTQKEALLNKDELIREIELQYDKEEAIGNALQYYASMRNGQRILQVDVWDREINISQNDVDQQRDEFESYEEEAPYQFMLRSQNTIYD